MRTLTLLIYIAIGVLVAAFASQNWDRTALWLPGGYEAYWPLGAYIIAAFLLGLLPMAVMHSFSRWRWQRRHRKLERQIEGEAAPASPEVAPYGERATPPLQRHENPNPVA